MWFTSLRAVTANFLLHMMDYVGFSDGIAITPCEYTLNSMHPISLHQNMSNMSALSFGNDFVAI